MRRRWLGFAPDGKRGRAPTTATAARPAPDSRGVITYPDYQVLVADGDETVAQIAGRLGIASDALAQRNGLTTSYRPRPGEVLLLPGTTGSGEIEAIAGTAIAASTMTGGNAAATTPVPPAPVRHRVESGETAYSIARTYDVSVKALADWNGLDSDYSLRAGQTLLIPTAAGAPRRGRSRPPQPRSSPSRRVPGPVPPPRCRPARASRCPRKPPPPARQPCRPRPIWGNTTPGPMPHGSPCRFRATSCAITTRPPGARGSTSPRRPAPRFGRPMMG
ncbi:MAG: LysM peptidoglycan-binding domain-containing protein [Rhodobacteraceae bacterium]|nr:LysM peptidoglycan-binding domain-containing protein [Paracoccaceae bacterium]